MYFKRYTRTLSIFNFGKSTGDFHIIAICLDGNTKSQCWSVAALLFRALVSNFAFTAIYPWPVFALHLLVSALAHASNCIYFAVVFRLPFPSLQYSALQHSFSTVIRFFSSFSCTHFLSSLCQQPFWIFISIILKFVLHRMLAKCYW